MLGVTIDLVNRIRNESRKKRFLNKLCRVNFYGMNQKSSTHPSIYKHVDLFYKLFNPYNKRVMLDHTRINSFKAK